MAGLGTGSKRCGADKSVEGRRLSRLPALDGIRAIAVVLTSLVHVLPRQVPGGIFGVDMFFVLSGFLITSILLSAAGSEGGIDLRGFYVRRVRRLLPAVLLLLVVFTVVVLSSGPSRHELLVTAVVDAAVVLYVFNWSDAFGHSPPWQVDHLWSLSVEEQFYLLWPLALIVALRYLSKRQTLLLSAAAALISTVAQGTTFLLTGSVEWAYLTTPLHASGILLGCLIAQVYTWGLAQRQLDWLAARQWPAWAAVAVLVVLSVATGVDDTFTYVGGMFLAVLAAAVLVSAVIAQDVSKTSRLLARVLSSRALVAIGKRSYSLYLWQNFMAWAMTPLRGTVWFVPANVVATAIAAEISYRFIERRFMSRPSRDPAVGVSASSSDAPRQALSATSLGASVGGALAGGVAAGTNLAGNAVANATTIGTATPEHA